MLRRLVSVASRSSRDTEESTACESGAVGPLLVAQDFTAVEQLPDRNLESIGDLKDVVQPGAVHAVLDAVDGFAVNLGKFSKSFLTEPLTFPYLAQSQAELSAQLSEARRGRGGHLPTVACMILKGLYQVWYISRRVISARPRPPGKLTATPLLTSANLKRQP